MKLRNKKTGEITTRIDVSESGEKFWVLGKKPCMYDTLSELNSEWEDYTPAEPLIKDEKIRKAVRAWAEACDIESCYLDCGEFCTKHREINCCIGFGESVSEIPLEEKHYTIAELCGEEEE